jgi:SAM-dependent methyltransferase
LDVGCGDGLFARIAYPDKHIWGVDVDPTEVKRAQRTASYQTLICGNVCCIQLPPEFFGSAIANCSLEHVPDLAGALANIRGSLKPGALFVLIVPTPDWSQKTGLAEGLTRVGLRGVAKAYGRALDRVFKHAHLHDAGWWSDRLRDAGFETVEIKPIVTRATSWTFELLLPASAVGYVVKRITGRWVLAPSLRGATSDATRALVERLLRRLPAGPVDTGGEYLIVARATGDVPDVRPHA